MIYKLVISLLLVGFVSSEEVYTYKTYNLTVPIDHFSFTNTETFQLRYLVNDTFWKGGPIFFYTGNEGDIELFAQNTGFIWDIAPEFNALIVFAEHRYYGKSLPYGEASFSDLTKLGYLTSNQALADFVYVLDYIQKLNGKTAKRKPVIAFGGSYGGMLAAWMRLKYPYIVDGAVASSAPIYQFQGLTPCNSFNNIVANVFNVSSASGECAKNIKRSWSVIRNITNDAKGKAWLTNEWKLCKPLNTTQDISELIDGLTEIYGNIAMINYPYETKFLAPVPAHPVRALCSYIDKPDLNGQELLTTLINALSIYTNYTGTTRCLNFSKTVGKIDEKAWDFQACTEMIMPMCTDERNELFEPSAWDYKKYSEDCFKKFGVNLTRVDLPILEYGGKEVNYSNMIFTNGLLDPWAPGGVLKTKTESVYTFLMPEAAHHLDLRANNDRDPISVIRARMNIKSIIKIWLQLFNQYY